MSRPLSEFNLTEKSFKKEGKFKPSVIKEILMVYNTKKKYIYNPKDLTAVFEDDTIYFKDVLSTTLNKGTDIIDNFISMNESEVLEMTIAKVSTDETKNDKNIVWLDNLTITEETHVFNREIIKFLIERFNSKIISLDKKKITNVIKMLKNESHIPVTHKKLEPFFENIGTTYQTFINYIKEKDDEKEGE